MPRKFKFVIGETILCYHGLLIYEAKGLQVVKKDDRSVIYLIHYVGWNKKWDEWISEGQILSYNKQNLNKQAKLKMASTAQSSIQKPKSNKAENLEHNMSKQDNQDVENNQPGTSKDQVPYSDVSDKLCDEPDPAVKIEKQVLKGEFQDKNSLPSVSKISVKEQEQQISPNSSSNDIPDKGFEKLHEYVDRTPEKDDSVGNGNNSTSSSSPDIAIQVFEALHPYVQITSDKDVSECEGNNSTSSFSTDIPDTLFDVLNSNVDSMPEKDISGDGNSSCKYEPDKVCEEHQPHTYGDRTPEDLNEEEENCSASCSSLDTPVNELQEPLLFVDCDNSVLRQIEFKIQLPAELKEYLIDDWDLVCRQKKLVTLPEKHNLTNIFSSYLNYKCETCPSVNWQGGAGQEMLLGLETYFTTVLNTQLLYNIEQPQYNDIRSNFENVPVQRIYGGIHLLRLFVKLGPLLSYSPNMTEPDTVRRLTFYFEDLLQYLLLKKSEYFGIEHYENASEEYLRRVQ